MSSKFVNVLMLAVGAAIGSAVAWKVVKTRYEEIAQEEIDSVKEEYASLMQKMRDKLKESVANDSEDDSDGEDYYPDDDDRELIEHEQDMINYHKIASTYCSSSDEDEKTDKKGADEEVPYINGPYVISPEEFGTNPDINCCPLDYYTDGILADGWGVPMDIEETIGEDSLAHFGDYVDDVVYVRNERTELDYEVTRDPRPYAEAVRTEESPYNVE